jgi:hypothetical protein
LKNNHFSCSDLDGFKCLNQSIGHHLCFNRIVRLEFFKDKIVLDSIHNQLFLSLSLRSVIIDGTYKIGKIHTRRSNFLPDSFGRFGPSLHGQTILHRWSFAFFFLFFLNETF